MSEAMLSPGWLDSSAKKLSWKSSSRTALEFAQAAQPHSNRCVEGSPNTVAPFSRGKASACERALATGARLIAASATAALSMIRLIAVSAAASSSGAGSAAIAASFQAS
jgi:hypothetical protein